MEQDFTEFRKSDKSLKHELGSVLKILSLTRVLLTLWWYPDLLHKSWLSDRLEPFLL